MFNPAALDVAAVTRASPTAIASRQATRWAALLRAAGRSAYFRGVLGAGCGADTPLDRMPVTDKRTLMANFADWVTDARIDLDELRAFVRDPARVGAPYLQHYTVWESSGSSGEPTIFVQDEKVLTVYDALESQRRDIAQPWRRMMDPLFLSERVAFVGAVDGHFASEVTMRRLRAAQPWRERSWRSFSILQPTAALAAELERFKPTILAGYPTAAALLAGEQRAGRLRIAPQEVWTGGETLTPAQRALIEESFDCALRNSYGASEFLPIAWECAHGRLHVNADWVILEAVDAQHRPVAPGQMGHTTLLTNLANHVQPIIRLDIGDRITLPPVQCGCRSHLPVIEVQGRCDDALTFDGRDGVPVTLLPLALSTVLEDDAGVADFQLEQTGPRTLRLRLGPSADGACGVTCKRVLRAFAAAQGIPTLRVEVVAPAELEHGRSGKLCRIKVLRRADAAPSDAPRPDRRNRPRRPRSR